MMSALFGNLALFFLLVANTYTPIKYVANKLMPDNKALRQSMGDLLKAHIKCNIIGFIFGIFHMLLEFQSNWMLYTSMVIMAWLTLAGFLMRSKVDMNRDIRKYVRLLHSQIIIFWIMVAMLIVGHLMVLGY